MATLYAPTLTYDPITDPQATQATHYQLERSPGDGFIYEAIADPVTGTATPFYHSDSLIIATAGKRTHCSRRDSDKRPQTLCGHDEAGTCGRWGVFWIVHFTRRNADADVKSAAQGRSATRCFATLVHARATRSSSGPEIHSTMPRRP